MKAIIAIALALSCAVADANQAFCAGFAAGFKAGACYKQFSCLPPLTPLCPLADLGETTYQHGYQRGFLEGLQEQR